MSGVNAYCPLQAKDPGRRPNKEGKIEATYAIGCTDISNAAKA